MTKEKNIKIFAKGTYDQGTSEKRSPSVMLGSSFDDQKITASNFRDTFGINLQLGHERRYRHPAMTGFLYGQRKGVGDFFDLREFSRHLKQAYRFVEEIASSSNKGASSKDVEGKLVIFVAKDKSHYKLLKPLFASLRDVFQHEDMKKTTKATPLLLEKWTPGLLTQGRLIDTHRRHQGGHPFSGVASKERLLSLFTDGNKSTKCVQEAPKVPIAVPALIITFGNKLIQQIKREANITRTPLIAVVDSDQDPRGITYVIPCNDDNYKGQYFLGRVLLDPFFLH